MIESRFQNIRDNFLLLFRAERERMADLSDSEFQELLHRAEELTSSESFSMRAAAEIIRAGATLILEERKP